MQVELALAAAKTYKAKDVKTTMESVDKIIRKLRMDVVTLSGEKNPQVVAMYQRSKDRLELLEALVHSMNGRHSDLRIYE